MRIRRLANRYRVDAWNTRGQWQTVRRTPSKSDAIAQIDRYRTDVRVIDQLNETRIR